MEDDYDPRTSSSYSNAIAFTGQRKDTLDDGDLQLMYYKNRYYNPTTGRFLQRDPKGYVDGMNFYEYVKSMPTISYDPYGLATYLDCYMGCKDAAGTSIFQGHLELCFAKCDRHSDDFGTMTVNEAEYIGRMFAKGYSYKRARETYVAEQKNRPAPAAPNPGTGVRCIPIPQIPNIKPPCPSPFKDSLCRLAKNMLDRIRQDLEQWKEKEATFRRNCEKFHAYGYPIREQQGRRPPIYGPLVGPIYGPIPCSVLGPGDEIVCNDSFIKVNGVEYFIDAPWGSPAGWAKCWKKTRITFGQEKWGQWSPSPYPYYSGNSPSLQGSLILLNEALNMWKKYCN